MAADVPVIRVLIADDHPVVREGMASILRAFDDLELVGEASDGAAAVDLCMRLHPDVVLMDLVMPKLDGAGATQAIREQLPDIQVVIMTTFSDAENVGKALRAGALGYVLKDASVHEIAEALRAANAGQAVLAHQAAQSLVAAAASPPIPKFNLSAREREVLGLMARGLSNAQIGRALYLSTSTIKFHVSSILGKLGAESRVQAVALGIDHGLVPPSS